MRALNVLEIYLLPLSGFKLLQNQFNLPFLHTKLHWHGSKLFNTSILVGRHVSREFVKQCCLLAQTCCIKTSIFSVYSTYLFDTLSTVFIEGLFFLVT